jgi:hypothetical protein
LSEIKDPGTTPPQFVKWFPRARRARIWRRGPERQQRLSLRQTGIGVDFGRNIGETESFSA